VRRFSGEEVSPVAKKIAIPVTDADVVKNLKAGEEVLLTGKMLTARDAAHKRLIELLDKGEPLPVDLQGACIYYRPAPRPPAASTPIRRPSSRRA